MKVLFAGPSIYGVHLDLSGVYLRPPAAQGDVLDAVENGATAIGIVDGTFDEGLSVWHKEILYALTKQVEVLGASSMGALRAAECFHFGMRPIGTIAQNFIEGVYDDDSVVAVTHGPLELGSMPLTESLVDVWASLDLISEKKLLPNDIINRIAENAESTFFKDRNLASLFVGLKNVDEVKATYLKHKVSLKTKEAIELIDILKTL